jgi:hypothetical protein
MFQTYIAKVNLDIAYIATGIHTCFKSIFQIFNLFQLYATNVSSLCFKSISGCCTCCNTRRWRRHDSRVDVASRAEFDAGRMELRASGMGVGAASGHAAGARRPDASASVNFLLTIRQF